MSVPATKKRSLGAIFRRFATTLVLAATAASGLYTPMAAADNPQQQVAQYVHVEKMEAPAGTRQSPIDLSATMTAASSSFKMQYTPAPLSVEKDGHGVKVNYPAGSKVEINGKSFELVQFHFHTPSEYRIDGKRFDMEVHFVHKDAAGKLGVIGILINAGAENKAVAPLLASLNGTAGPDAKIDPAAFFPKNLQHFEFQGSLTTPPYTEGVSWFVLSTPIQFSQAQIDTFRGMFPDNARETQPANNRVVVLRY